MSLNYPIPQVACGCMAVRPSNNVTHVAGCEDGVMVLTPISALRPINNFTIDSGSLSSLDLLGCSALPNAVSANALLVCDDGVRSTMNLGAGQSVMTDSTSALQPYDVGLRTFFAQNPLGVNVFSAGYGLVPFSEPISAGVGVFELSGRQYYQDTPDNFSSVLANVTLTVSAEVGVGDIDLVFGGLTNFGQVHIDAQYPGLRPERYSVTKTMRLDTNVSAIDWSLSASTYPTTTDSDLGWAGDDVIWNYHLDVVPLFYYAS